MQNWLLSRGVRWAERRFRFSLKNIEGEIPGSPVFRALCFHCCGPHIHYLVRELRSHKPFDVAKYIFMCVCVWVCAKLLQLYAIPMTVARQAPLSVGFSRQEYWSRCPFLLQGIFPRIFPIQGSNPGLLSLLHCRQMLYCSSEPPSSIWSDEFKWPHFYRSPAPGGRGKLGECGSLQSKWGG